MLCIVYYILFVICMHLVIDLSISRFNCPSTCSYLFLHIYLSSDRSIYLFMYLWIYLSIHLSIHIIPTTHHPNPTPTGGRGANLSELPWSNPGGLGALPQGFIQAPDGKSGIRKRDVIVNSSECIRIQVRPTGTNWDKANPSQDAWWQARPRQRTQTPNTCVIKEESLPKAGFTNTSRAPDDKPDIRTTKTGIQRF